MNTDEVWAKGLIGKIKRCEFEDQWLLEQRVMDWGIVVLNTQRNIRVL